MSLVIVTFLQCIAHIHLPVAHTAVIAVACCIFTIGFAVSGITSTPGWPSDAVGLGVWAVIVGVSSNAFTATMASFAWEARCRSQQLMAAAARAAEAEATALLENLLPPVVVAEYKAGRVTKPALAHDVVILWGDIVGFTLLASRLEPLQLMEHLNTIYRWVGGVIWFSRRPFIVLVFTPAVPLTRSSRGVACGSSRRSGMRTLWLVDSSTLVEWARDGRPCHEMQL